MTPLGLKCATPTPQHRPPIPAHHDHVLVPLAVRSSETNKDFVSRNFAFYDCGRHNTCGSCVRSNWACNWCVYENTCTHNASSCSGNVVSGENVSILQLLREVCGPPTCTTLPPSPPPIPLPGLHGRYPFYPLPEWH